MLLVKCALAPRPLFLHVVVQCPAHVQGAFEALTLPEASVDALLRRPEGDGDRVGDDEATDVGLINTCLAEAVVSGAGSGSGREHEDAGVVIDPFEAHGVGIEVGRVGEEASGWEMRYRRALQ